MDDKVAGVLKRMEEYDAQCRVDYPDDKWRRPRSIPREEGEWLSLLVRTVGARNIVELGTSQGYSTIWLALAARETGGHVTSFDIDEKKHRMATDNLAEAGLSDRVTLLAQDAHKGLAELGFEFDFVFLDAEKDDYLPLAQIAIPKMKPGGLLIAHNASNHAEGLADYLSFVRTHPDLQSVLLPIGKGEEVSLKV